MTVYVPHMLTRKMPGGHQQSIDLSAAEKYGELAFLLPPSAMMSPSSAMRILRFRLQDFRNTDYILLGGDLAAVAAAVSIAASRNGGRVNVLKWDSLYQEYGVVQIETFEAEE